MGSGFRPAAFFIMIAMKDELSEVLWKAAAPLWLEPVAPANTAYTGFNKYIKDEFFRIRNLIQDTCYPQLEWSKEQLNEFISKNFKGQGYADKERPFEIAKYEIDEFRKKIRKNIEQRFNATSQSFLPRYISRHEIRAEVIGRMDNDYMYLNSDEKDTQDPYNTPLEPFSDLLEYMLTTLTIAWPNYASRAHQAELSADMFRYYLQSKELQFYRVWMDRHRKRTEGIFRIPNDAFDDITERLTVSAQEYFRKRDKNLRKFEIMTEGSDVKLKDDRPLTMEDVYGKSI